MHLHISVLYCDYQWLQHTMQLLFVPLMQYSYCLLPLRLLQHVFNLLFLSLSWLLLVVQLLFVATDVVAMCRTVTTCTNNVMKFGGNWVQ